MLREYRKASAWIETDRREVHEDRDELVGRTGVFIPQGEHRAGFYHLSFQEFFAAQRLADGEPEALAQTILERGAAPAWRNTLSFLYGKFLAANSTPDRPVRLLTAVIGKLEPSAPATLVVAADCLEILTRRGYGLPQPLPDRLRTLCLESMTDAADPRVRCEVGSALARIGDPRFRADAWFLPADSMLGFMEIPAGRFTMGTDKKQDPSAIGDELPAHPVTLPAFYIARFPVTVAQFRAYVEDAGVTPGDPDCLGGVANHPVVYVSWFEALAYCNWLTQKLGEWPGTPDTLARVLRAKGTGDKPWRVTLASEAEWEKAARGTDGRIYPWEGPADPNKANYDDTGIGGTSTVGCFPGGASPYEVEELSGNVWEWTRSLYGAYPYQPGKDRENLKAGKDQERVVRGGSFGFTDRSVRAACRYWDRPDSRVTLIGFRVVVSSFFSEL
jgi:formylglycine-generating enzyme required for sulfatase activity